MSFQFTERQSATLALICETINPEMVPSQPDDQLAVFENHAGKYPIVEEFRKRLAKKSTEEQLAFVRHLRFINLPVACWLATQRLRPFNFLKLTDRAQVLAYWRDHRNGKLRSFFQSVKRLTLYLSYADTGPKVGENRGRNETWSALGYKGQNPLAAQPEPAVNLARFKSWAEEIECDYLVIGSGAGGSVMAAELAERNCRVIVAEAADSVAPSELGNSESEGMARYFEAGGSQATDDLGVTVLSGNAVGGGTIVNWMTCLDPPQSVLCDWAEKFGLNAVLQEQFRASLLAVRQRMNVSTSHSQLNEQNRKLLEGCQHFGFRTQQIERNAKDCSDCGYCGFGCRAGSKQDARQTFLADAMRLGAELLPSCKVERIVRDGNIGKYAIAHIREADGDIRTLKIKFQICVVACGAIQTPALLLRSGFANPHIGQNLRLHPTTAVVGFYDDPILPWQGAPQTIVCDEFRNMDGNGYGVRLEVAPVHPGLAASSMAWRDPLHHKRLMQRIANMANTIVIARDQGQGEVTLGHDANPKISYSLSRADEEHLLFGAERAAEIQRAAGAKLILGPHQQPLELTADMNDRQFNRALGQMSQMGGDANRLSLFSAHQMGTARIGDSPLRGAIDRQGRCYDAQNVYVCDASAFPTAIGVNPMITIMGLSHMLSQSLRARGFSVYDF